FNLCGGSYNITITDLNNCSLSNTFSIDGSTSPLAFNEVVNQPMCNGDLGSITISPSGGTGSLAVLWSSGSTENTISALAAGSYSVTLTDANNCSSTDNFTINAAPSAITLNGSATQPACFGETGSITISPAGGTGTLAVLWSSGSTENSISALAAGSYSV